MYNGMHAVIKTTNGNTPLHLACQYGKYTYIYNYIHTCMYVCICIHTYILTYIHIIHTYIHMHSYPDKDNQRQHSFTPRMPVW